MICLPSHVRRRPADMFRVVLALIAVFAAGLVSGTSAHAAPASATTQTAADTITVDDSVQGGGQDEFDYQGSGWGQASGEDAPANPYQATNSWADSAGDTVTFRFTGTRLTFHGVTDPSHGIGTISVDGGTPTDIDFYSAVRTGDVPLWTSTALPDGSHTFTLAWTGRKNPSSSGTVVTVDRVGSYAVRR